MEAYYEAYYNYDDEYLEHYGIKGMKWGVRRTPEQLGHHIDKQKRKLAKNVAAAKKAKAAGDKEKLKKLNIKTLKLKKDIANSKKELDKMNKDEHDRLLKTGTAQEVYEKRHLFSKKELEDVMSRIDTETRLANMPAQELTAKINAGKAKAEAIMSAVNTGVKGIETWDNFAKGVNTVLGEDTLTVFKDRYEKNKEKKKEAERAEQREIVRSGDYNKIMENRQRLTDDEFNQAMNRISKSGEALKNQAQGRSTAISAHNASVAAARAIDSERETEHNQRRSERQSQRQSHENSLDTARQGKRDAANALRDHQTETEMHRARLRENQNKVQALQRLVDNNNDDMRQIRNTIRMERGVQRMQDSLNNLGSSTQLQHPTDANGNNRRYTQVRPITQEERAQYTQMQNQNRVAQQRIHQLQQEINESQNFVNASAERTRQLKNQMKAYEQQEKHAQRQLDRIPAIEEYDHSATNNLINSMRDELLRSIA